MPTHPSTEREQPNATTGTLRRGLRILEEVTSAQAPLSLTTIAELVGFDVSTTSRLLKTLEDAEYIQRDPELRLYSPTPKAVQPLPIMHPLNLIRHQVQPVVHELSQTVHQTVLCIVFLRHERAVIAVSQYPGSITPYYGSWARNPLHATASGKIMLMTMTPAERIARIGNGPYTAYGPGTTTDADQLAQELAVAATRGYTSAVDAVRAGTTAIATPIRTWTGQILGCLVTTGLTDALNDERIERIAEELSSQAVLLPMSIPAIQQMVQFLPSAKAGEVG